MDTQEFKSRIAEAVHRAVCQVTDSDGCGKCLYYALGGAILLNKVTKRLFVPQIGGFVILTSPPDCWHGVDMSAEKNPMKSFANGDFHCWISELSSRRAKIGNQPQNCKAIIDLSSRHYHRLLKHVFPDIEWNREPPPDYVWPDGGSLPDWIRVKPEAEPMSVLFDHAFVSPSARSDLSKIAFSEFHQLRSPAFKGETALALRRYRKALKEGNGKQPKEPSSY